MKRTLSTSRTLNNINNSGGISAADKQQITDNKNNIVLIENELNDLSNNTAGLTLTVQDLSSSYYLYKTSNNAALASAVSDIATNTSAVGTLTSGLSTANANISTNSGNINTVTASALANTNAISSLTGTVSSNTSAISTNAGNIATNTAGLVVANQDITAIESAAVTLTGRVNANETTLLGKQDTLTSASVLSLRSIDFPVVVGTGNITLPGNAVLSSGNGSAIIQNGNIIDFTSINTTLLTNVTLGNTWKYENSGGYYVRNASNNNIIEYINPSDGTHNWYNSTDNTKLFTWHPTLERLFCSGFVLSKKFLHQISGTVVRGYGFFRFEGTSGTINMNTTGGIDIPWTNVHVDGETFVPVGTTQVKIVETGYYEIGFNVYLTSNESNANPTIRIRVNGLDTAYLAWSFIRASNNHNESSWSLSPVLMSLTANDVISVQGRFTSNGKAGGCYLYSNSAAINKAYSSLMLKRVA